MKKIFILLSFMLPVLALRAQPSDTYIQNIMSNGYMPGATAAIVKDGHWMYQQNWGKANLAENKDVTRETIFMMASVSKTIMGTALMQLWEKGAFQLDDNINNYLPFAVNNPNFPNDSITFRQLMTHTSSIRDNGQLVASWYGYGDSPMSLDTLLRNYFVPGGSFYNASLNFYYQRPGKAFHYSNVGSTLAAYLVQTITGDDYAHYCDTAIFRKLCMNNTAFKLAGLGDTSLIARPYAWDQQYYDMGLYGYPDYPDGQLRTHITALARFMTAYMQYGIYNGERILDSTTVVEMMKSQSPFNTTQGLVFMQYMCHGDTLWGHTGGDMGVSTAMFFSYKTKTGTIVFTNGDGTGTNNMLTILDTLYAYGRTLTPSSSDVFPPCELSTGIKPAPEAEMTLQLYPNPASQTAWLQVEAAAGTMQVVLTDMQGRLVREVHNGQVPGSGKLSIDLRNVNSGLYLLHVTSGQTRRSFKLTVLP